MRSPRAAKHPSYAAKRMNKSRIHISIQIGLVATKQKTTHCDVFIYMLGNFVEHLLVMRQIASARASRAASRYYLYQKSPFGYFIFCTPDNTCCNFSMTQPNSKPITCPLYFFKISFYVRTVSSFSTAMQPISSQLTCVYCNFFTF